VLMSRFKIHPFVTSQVYWWSVSTGRLVVDLSIMHPGGTPSPLVMSQLGGFRNGL